MRRRWLRPKWYVADMGGGWSSGSVYPDTVRQIPEDEPDPVCSVCGIPCPSGGYDLAAGYMCLQHGEQWHQDHPASRWRKLWWRIDGPLDRLYWWYAQRFGERVERP